MKESFKIKKKWRKNGTLAQKSVWSCDIYDKSIDREFVVEQEEI
jgi:hypothetical protein